MSNFDLEWVASERPHTVGSDPGAHDRARMALMRHTAAAGGPARRPGLPRFPRRPILGAAMTAALAAAAVAAVAILGSGGAVPHATGPRIEASRPGAASGSADSGSASGSRAPTGRHSGSPLARLAAYVSASAPPTGDATLEVRTTTDGSNAPITVDDLYTDSGQYYFAQTEAGLPAQIRAHHDLGGGQFAREVAAAKLAATGDVSQAANDMVKAPNSRHAATTTPNGPLWDNWLWENSLDALTAGAGDPQVRAGVLKLLATLPGVTVTNTTVNGQSALTVAASGPELGPDYTEQLTIDAQTGVPIRFAGGATGRTPASTVTYHVSRVTLADLVRGSGASS